MKSSSKRNERVKSGIDLLASHDVREKKNCVTLNKKKLRRFPRDPPKRGRPSPPSYRLRVLIVLQNNNNPPLAIIIYATSVRKLDEQKLQGVKKGEVERRVKERKKNEEISD